MLKEIMAIFREYMGTGLIVALYLFCLLYLFLQEERKYIRAIFLCVPVLILLLFFNPLFAGIVRKTSDDEIYYRILWLLPLTAGIAYTVCHICGKLRGKRRYAFLAGVVLIVMLSGKCVYDSPPFAKAENRYHVPDSVVHICDAIIVPGREVQAAFPRELLQYVRQYTPFVCMPFGREVLVERWDMPNELSQAMEQEVIDLEELVPLARKWQCHYIILREGKEILGELRDFDWEIFGKMDGYVIYRDTGVPLEIP